MLLSVALALAMVGSSSEPYTGPRPGDEFWTNLALHAGIQPLRVHRSLRLIRVAWALFPGTVVTVVPTADGGAEVETRVLSDWRKEGASVRTRPLAPDRYESLRELAKTGLWAQPPVAPTGALGATDGVVWYI